MATIKSFTSLEQSKKLAEILPLESADMIWVLANPDLPMIRAIAYEDSDKNNKYYEILPSWSLSALLGVLPAGTRLLKSANISSVGDVKYHCDCLKGTIDEWFDNPVDACYDMIIHLNELNLL